VARRSHRSRPAWRRSAGGGRPQDLSGFQVRGDGGDSGLPGVHRQIPAVYRARRAEERTGSHQDSRCFMSCSPFDLRDYALDELAQPDRRQVENHVRACSGCREELGRLQTTQAALRSVADEEIPQRIAFVSDKVFAPSPWRRAAQAFWNSSARLGFVSAAMLSCALVVTALYRPSPVPAGSTPVSQVEKAQVDRIAADFDRRVQAAVQKAVAESEARQAEKTT